MTSPDVPIIKIIDISLIRSLTWKYSKLRQRLHIVGGEYDH